MTQQPAPDDMSDQEVASFHGHLASLWRRIQGLPLPVREQIGLQEEENTSQDLDDLIASAYSQIENAEKNLTNDSQMSDKMKALEALKVTVPYHVTFGQKDETWINDAINQIIQGSKPNVSTVVSSTVAATTNISNNESMANGSKPSTPEA